MSAGLADVVDLAVGRVILDERGACWAVVIEIDRLREQHIVVPTEVTG